MLLQHLREGGGEVGNLSGTEDNYLELYPDLAKATYNQAHSACTALASPLLSIGPRLALTTRMPIEL